MRYLSLAVLGVLGFGCAALVNSQPLGAGADMVSAEQRRVDADVAPRLVPLLDERNFKPIMPEGAGSTPALEQLVYTQTPAGLRLRIRYMMGGIGIPLAQSLAASQDSQLKLRLVEAARWTNRPQVRAEALVALAALRDPEHMKFFREAILDKSLDMQFAGIEALQIYGNAQQIGPMLIDIANNSWSPVVKVYAAQAALRMGDPKGRDKLLSFLLDRNWVVRAMAARYLGEMGQPGDFETIVGRLGPEQGNPYVVAELCIAGLKLASRRGPGASTQPVSALPRGTGSTPAAVRSSAVLELEPLVVTAPRLRLQQRADVRIDNDLVRLLEKVAETGWVDPGLSAGEVAELNQFQTPSGIALKLRYSDLSYLITEGLAGVSDFTLVQRLERMVFEKNVRPVVRAMALVSLAYTPNRSDTLIFQNVLREPVDRNPKNIQMRFAAVEALEHIGGSQAIPVLADAADRDDSMVVRVYAAQAMARAGDGQGRQHLLRYMNDPDWVIRSMAIRALGDYGQKNDYFTISSLLNRENNNFVIVESCLAMMKLASKQQ